MFLTVSVSVMSVRLLLKLDSRTINILRQPDYEWLTPVRPRVPTVGTQVIGLHLYPASGVLCALSSGIWLEVRLPNHIFMHFP